MSKYKVKVYYEFDRGFEVDANNELEAIKIAHNQAFESGNILEIPGCHIHIEMDSVEEIDQAVNERHTKEV
tara:strand:- start:368 stop:580 length:213 start_codon:yes stop_codon:yes gene_type:complete